MAASSPDVLDAYLLRSAISGERGLSWVRVVLALLGALNVIAVLLRAPERLHQGPKYAVMLIGLSLALGLSGLILRGSRDGTRLPLGFGTAGALDAAVLAVVVGSSVIWPSPTFRGFLTLPHSALFGLVIVASAVRISTRAVASSVVACGGTAAALLVYDRLRNPVSLATPFDDYTVYGAFLLCCALLALDVARRTRRMVAEGASASLRAERALMRFGVFVSPEVAARAVEVDTLRPGGERRRVAVLFCDLRGFTSWCEALPPERLVAELNAWLEAMVAVIGEEQGIVDKYMGDAIMAVWGVPSSTGDEAVRAVRAARRMQATLALHNEARARIGLAPLRQGIGVHVGEVVAGNIGASHRLQYTVMGGTVNLASRLQEATRDAGVSVLLSEAAAEAASDHPGVPPMRASATVRLRGLAQPVKTWTFDEEITSAGLVAERR